jgi:pimeloyl-ACP methyl ester carboxylesterase
MLFVHGYPEFWFSWRYQLKEFAATHWVVALDLRGYGDSEKPTKKSEYNIDILQRDIVDLVKALKRESCILVAHDWGGVIAWNVAANYPEVVEKLIILNSPHPDAFKGKIIGSLGQFLKSWYIFFYQLPYIPEWAVHTNDLEAFDTVFSDENKQLTITEEELEAYKYTYSRKGAWTPPINYYRQNFSIAKSLVEPPKPLSIIRVPTLFIWGDGDIHLSKDLPELTRPYVENMTIKYISKGNHFVQQHKPAEVNAVIAEYLKKA